MCVGGQQCCGGTAPQQTEKNVRFLCMALVHGPADLPDNVHNPGAVLPDGVVRQSVLAANPACSGAEWHLISFVKAAASGRLFGMLHDRGALSR